MNIRTASVNDAEKLLEIYAPYVENTAVSLECRAPSAEEFKSRIEKVLKAYPYLVAEEDGRIVGYAYAGPFHPREAFRFHAEVSIYIDRGEHGKGYGRALYTAVEKILSTQNILTVCACIAKTDREDDEYLTDDSIRFHSHMGYVLTAEHKNCGYKFGRWYGIIWMEKAIGKKTDYPEPFIPFPLLDKSVTGEI